MAANERFTDVESDTNETFGAVPPPLETIPEDDAVNEWAIFSKDTVGESEIPPKYRELMGLAAAANIT